MRRTALAAAVCALASAAVAAPVADAVPPDRSVVELPPGRFRDVVVDTPRGHVFVSDGDDSVHVRDLDGGPVATIPNQPGASQLALSPDGGTLYVALPGADAISAIDTTALAERTRYHTGIDTCPEHLAVAPGYVWFGYGCRPGYGRVGVVDLTGPAPVTELHRTGLYVYHPPGVTYAPGSPPRLLVADLGGAPSGFSVFDVAGTTLTAAGGTQTGSNLADLAVTPDGEHVYTASGSPYHWRRFRLDGVREDKVYGAEHAYPNAVAVAGGHVAGGSFSYHDKDVRVYRADGTLVRSYELGTTLEPRGLAFSADGRYLYAVASPVADSRYRLHVLRQPTKYATTVALAKPAAPRVGTGYALAGAVTSGTAIPAGSVVHVTRAGPSGTTRLPYVRTTASGAFTVADEVGRRGTYTYTAEFYGDATHAPAQRSVSFYVRGLTPALAVATDRTTYRYGQTARVTASLGPTHGNRTVRITAQPYGAAESDLVTGTVGADGTLTAYYTVGRRTRFRAYFAGDSRYEPRATGRTVTAGVVVRQALSGHYAAADGYRYYRSGTDPVLDVRVAPERPGSCVTARVQAYYADTWQDVESRPCVPLDAGSAARFVLDRAFATGVRYRVRAEFAGDAYHAPTPGTWLRLRFT